MPFTLSHPAAALPLAPLLGRHAVWSALVIGCMAPDLPYFLGAPFPRTVTHTLASVLWFSVPAGLGAYAFFQGALRRPAIFLLPRATRRRLDPAPVWAPWGSVVLCLVLGALSHVLWDAFTHASGPSVGVPPRPGESAYVGTYPLWPYGVVQHASTVLGAAALVHAVWRWHARTPPRRDEPDPPRVATLRRSARVAAVALPAVGGLAVGFALAPPVPTVWSLARFAAHAVVAGLSTLAAFVALLGGTLALTARRRPV